MKEIDIVQCLIEQRDLYYMQIRGSEPKIGAAGQIGCFGGKINPGEEPVCAMTRELSEETNLNLESSDLSYIGKLNVVSDNNNKPVKIKSKVFYAKIDMNTVIAANDGTLFPIHKDRVSEYQDKMTPATRAIFSQLIT
jgi:ADP-ribose pyrophosphatase YjhB (NUDIX family)